MKKIPSCKKLQFKNILGIICNLSFDPEYKRWGLIYNYREAMEVRYGNSSDILKLINEINEFDLNREIFKYAIIFELTSRDSELIHSKDKPIIYYDSYIWEASWNRNLPPVQVQSGAI